MKDLVPLLVLLVLDIALLGAYVYSKDALIGTLLTTAVGGTIGVAVPQLKKGLNNEKDISLSISPNIKSDTDRV